MRQIFLALQSLVAYLQRNGLRIFVVLTILLVVVGVAARMLFPEWFLPRYEVEFTGDPNRPREEAPFYSLSNQVPPDALGAYLSQKLALPEQTPGGATYYDPEAQTSITAAVDLSGAQFTDTLASPQEGDSLPPRDSAEQAARLFLQELGYPTQLELVATGFQHLDAFHIEESSEEEATAYRFSFVPRLDGVEVSTDLSATPEIVVSVSQRGVFKAYLPPLIFSVTAEEAQSIISVQQAISALELGNFTSPQVEATAERTGVFSFDRRDLVYTPNADTQTLIPMYRFTGTYTNTGGQSQAVQVFVPATQQLGE